MLDKETDPRRLSLVHLSFERKLEIIVEMQRRENAIREAVGRPTRPVWELICSHPDEKQS